MRHYVRRKRVDNAYCIQLSRKRDLLEVSPVLWFGESVCEKRCSLGRTKIRVLHGSEARQGVTEVTIMPTKVSSRTTKTMRRVLSFPDLFTQHHH